MRRAALAAIALVAGLLLLLPRDGSGRRARREAPEPVALEAPPRTPDEPSTDASTPPGAAVATPPKAPPPVTSGFVIDGAGKPIGGIRLLAIPPTSDLWDAEDPYTAPGDTPAAPFAFTDEQGAFLFPDLPAGEYRLAVDEDNRTLDQPFHFRAGDKGLRVVAAAGWSPLVRVKDLATWERVERFTVRYRWPPDAASERVGEGSDGLFRVRLPYRDRETAVPCRIEADGYRDLNAWLSEGSQVTWLVPVVNPSVTLRVVFDDGGLCDEKASVMLKNRGATAEVPAVAAGPGLYRAAVPPGSWTLEFRPELYGGATCKASVELADGEEREVLLEIARGGDIVVKREPWDGKPWRLTVWTGTIYLDLRIVTARWESRHMRPGRYTFLAPEGLPGLASVNADANAWRREIELTAGSRHELTIE